MINSVRVMTDVRGVDETLTFREVSNGIIIKSISGLGPVKAELVTSKKASGDGVNYSQSNIGSRNLVFSLGLSEVGAKTIEDVRRDVYDYFPINRKTSPTDFIFSTDRGDRIISGYVESVEPEIFSKDPAMQVSVICVDPYFKDYPGNHSVTMPVSGTTTLSYRGKEDTGITLDIVVTDETSILFGHLTFQQDPTGPFVGFNIEDFDLQGITGFKLTVGDHIQIVTTPGKKKATLTRGSTVHNIMGAIKDTGGFYLKPEQWPYLLAGDRVNGWNPTFTLVSSQFTLSQLQVTISWDELIDGL